jgi:hypothetical protein
VAAIVTERGALRAPYSEVLAGAVQSYIWALERRLKEPRAPIFFRTAKLYGRSIEWLRFSAVPLTVYNYANQENQHGDKAK